MSYDTEHLRRVRLSEINGQPGCSDALEAAHGRVWDTGQLADEFDVIGFHAPFVGRGEGGAGVPAQSPVLLQFPGGSVRGGRCPGSPSRSTRTPPPNAAADPAPVRRPDAGLQVRPIRLLQQLLPDRPGRLNEECRGRRRDGSCRHPGRELRGVVPRGLRCAAYAAGGWAAWTTEGRLRWSQSRVGNFRCAA
jgi:hypothetical protein